MTMRNKDGELAMPDARDWEDHPDDLDWAYARKMFFGKSLEEAEELFLGNVIERTEDLRFMSRAPFQYYIRAFAAHVLSPRALEAEEPHSAASCFLGLVEEKLAERGGFVTPALLKALMPALEHVAANQAVFDADKDIFGDFQEQLGRIKKLAGP